MAATSIIMTCREAYEQNLRQAVIVWASIAGWTLFTFTLYAIVLKALIEGAPGLGAQFFGVSGVIQIVVVIMGSAVFFPTCTSCYCPTYQPWLYLIPTLEGIVGVLCLWRASDLSLRASQVSRDGVFTKVPSSADALEMTEVSEEEIADDDGETW